jgi:hypothetical protein
MEQMQIFSPLMDGSPLIYCLPVLQPDKAAVKVDVFFDFYIGTTVLLRYNVCTLPYRRAP